MPLGTITLTGTWLQANGQPATGSVLIAPTTTVVDPTNDDVYPVAPVTATLTSGSISITNVPVISQVDPGYTYTLTQRITGAVPQSYILAIPDDASGTVDIADVITSTPPALPTGVTAAQVPGLAPVQSVDGLTGAVDLSGRYAPLVDEVFLPATTFRAYSGTATPDDLASTGLVGLAMLATEATYFGRSVILPAHWATADVTLQWANNSASTAGTTIQRVDIGAYAAGDTAPTWQTGTNLMVAPPTQNVIQESAVDSGVTVDPTKTTSVAVFRFGHLETTTPANLLFLGVILTRAS